MVSDSLTERNPIGPRPSAFPRRRGIFADMLSALENHDAVVEMHRMRRLRKGGGGHGPARVVGIEIVNQGLASLDERFRTAQAAAIFVPVCRVEILHQIHAILVHARIEEFERRGDVAHDVAAVVDDGVWKAKLLEDALQELGVALIADPNRNLFFLDSLARRVDVEPNDACERPEIAFPELQRAALRNPDFYAGDRP